MKYEKPEIMTFSKEDLAMLELACTTCCCMDIGGNFN